MVNGNREYTITTDCGSVTFSGITALSDWIEIQFDGKFKVYYDSLSLRRNGLDYFDFVLKDGKDKSIDSLSINGKEKLRLVSMHKLPVLPLSWGGGLIEILPSKFIVCEDNPVISDTIRLVYNQKRLLKENHGGF